MLRSISVCTLALATICASTVLASAQVTSSPTETSNLNSSPVAYVYVSTAEGGTGQIDGFAAFSNGSLVNIPGSPFLYYVSSMAANSGWLFDINGSDNSLIESKIIGSDGAISQAYVYQVQQTGGGLVNLFLDHTGSSLYSDYYTLNNDYLAFMINQFNGEFSYLNDVPGGPGFGYVLSFIGNNQYGYSSDCYHFSPEIYGVQRNSSGNISRLNINPPLPSIPSGYGYCPYLAAADPTNHLAVAVQAMKGYGDIAGPYQFASYTADASGNLTTNSTYKNMPATLVGNVNDYWMSPSGKYLAVGGNKGLQLFHFNGANPLTRFTGLLTSTSIDQMFWDNANHLYAISRKAGKLFVYTVNSTGVTQAPGSPHTITGAHTLSFCLSNTDIGQHVPFSQQTHHPGRCRRRDVQDGFKTLSNSVSFPSNRGKAGFRLHIKMSRTF